jgi:hypothetical protein
MQGGYGLWLIGIQLIKKSENFTLLLFAITIIEYEHLQYCYW